MLKQQIKESRCLYGTSTESPVPFELGGFSGLRLVVSVSLATDFITGIIRDRALNLPLQPHDAAAWDTKMWTSSGRDRLKTEQLL
jgi:hypothetical protein